MSAELTYVQALNKALREEMELDAGTFLIGEDIAHYGGMFRVTEGLMEAFGSKRVLDTPISESAFVGMALGAALAGKRPIVELMFVDFSLVAMDQILNQVAKTTFMSGGKLPVPLVIRTQGGGYKGAAAQHSQMLEALLLHVPGLKVVAPSTASDAYHLLKAAIRDNNSVVFIEHKQLYPTKGVIESRPSSLGQAKVIQEGDRLSVLSYSYACRLCQEAASPGVEVIDLRTLNPLDWETISRSVRKTHRALIVHEAHRRCGVGADLAAQIQEKLFDDLDGPVSIHCAPDTPVPYARSLEDIALPSVASIQNAIQEALA